MTPLKNKNSPRRNTKGHKYRKYSLTKRMRLVEMVQIEKQSLASSAKALEIAPSSARLIMKTWRTEGRFFQKRSDRIKREKKEAAKAYELRRIENQKQKKLAKQRIMSKEDVQEAKEKQVKIEETLLETIKEPEIIQTPISQEELAPFANTCMFLAPVYLFCPQNVFP